jgi:hypothetical protein
MAWYLVKHRFSSAFAPLETGSDEKGYNEIGINIPLGSKLADIY